VSGIGIATAGVTLPGIVKDRFPARPAAATAGYSVPMMLGAAVSPAVTVPLRSELGSWQASLAFWALPSGLAVLVWLPVARRSRRRGVWHVRGGLPWRSRAAWSLAAFMSAQSALAYAYIAWLPPAYENRGWSAASAGALLGTMQLAQLVSALALPLVAERLPDRRPAVLAAVACSLCGALLLVITPQLAWLAVAILGLGLGGGFTLGLVLMTDFAASPLAAGRLAAMTFLVCYLAAATAPIAIGAVHDLTGTFASGFALLVLLASAQFFIGLCLAPRLHGSVR
jgi:MFS transporter, CP family, cyanate transporter